MRAFVASLSLSMAVACGAAPREPEPVVDAVPTSTTAPPQRATTPEATVGTLPPPVEVCLVSEGSRTRATAYPSRAGVYDPSAPIDPALLNWSLPNRGCVSPPLADTPSVPCPDEPPLPSVTAVPCGQ